MSTNKHDDRLNKLEQWLETYGDNQTVIDMVRFSLWRDANTLLGHSEKAHYVKISEQGRRDLQQSIRAYVDLANIVGVGLEDL